MSALKDRRVKAEAKVARTAKALETAKKELADLLAAERVMADITGESVDTRFSGSPISERDQAITKLLKTEASAAISPSDLYPFYVETSGENINLEAFRTALWRLQKKPVRDSEGYWTVRSDGGRYWREPTALDEFDELLG